MQDGPKLDAEAVEASAGVFVRNGTMKKMMMTIKLKLPACTSACPL
jgi:hypothetical protein